MRLTLQFLGEWTEGWSPDVYGPQAAMKRSTEEKAVGIRNQHISKWWIDTIKHNWYGEVWWDRICHKQSNIALKSNSIMLFCLMSFWTWTDGQAEWLLLNDNPVCLFCEFKDIIIFFIIRPLFMFLPVCTYLTPCMLFILNHCCWPKQLVLMRYIIEFLDLNLIPFIFINIR